MEARHPISNQAVPSPEDREDHHCSIHTTFNAACESCIRARAAFLPYPVSDRHVSQTHTTRSFGFTDQPSEASLRRLGESLADQIERESHGYAKRQIIGRIINDLLS